MWRGGGGGGPGGGGGGGGAPPGGGALAVFALVVQTVVVIGSPGAGLSAGEGVERLVSYFTVQSNLLVAVSSLLLAASPQRDGGTGWRVLRFAALLGITVTGIVYWSVLYGTQDLSGWNLFCDVAFHQVMPVIVLVGWLLFGPRPRVSWRVVGLTLLWPVAWLAYTLVHGEARDWYPYPFVDVARFGYARVTVNCVVVTALVVALASLYRWLDRRLPPTG